MARVARGLVNRAEIEAAAGRVAETLAPDVIRIRFSLGEDWSGDEAVFFRVVLDDAAVQGARLRSLTQRVIAAIRDEVEPDELGLEAYFYFRTVSEQEELREATWD